MRVISGIAKGLRLKSLDDLSTRPTMDRVKESLFNILAFDIQGCAVLDLFAGTGALGIEALSRGASGCTFLDNSVVATNIIKQNLEHTRLMDNAKIIICDADKFLVNSTDKYDIIFLDPPYRKDIVPEIIRIIVKNGLLKSNGIIIAESDIKDDLPNEIASIKKFREKKYGNTVLSFYGGKVF